MESKVRRFAQTGVTQRVIVRDALRVGCFCSTSRFRLLLFAMVPRLTDQRQEDRVVKSERSPSLSIRRAKPAELGQAARERIQKWSRVATALYARGRDMRIVIQVFRAIAARER